MISKYPMSSGLNGSATLIAALITDLLLTRGTGLPTFTRASAGTALDQDSVVRNAVSGQGRFTGARVVSNLFIATTTLSTQGVTAIAGQYTVSFSGTGTITFSGAFVGSLVGQGIATRVASTFTTTAGTLTCTVTGSVTSAQCEGVTGQSNQNPAEYVSVGVLASPYQGTGVDGVQCFSTLNGNTVAANVVTAGTGVAISTAILLGYLSEPAATQLVTPTAAIRDLTNAAWVKTTMTTTLTSVGADGAANSATRCTATAVNGMGLLTLTAAASSRTVSLLVKQITGSGAFQLTQDGISFTTVTVTGAYTLVQLNANVLNATYGFRIATSGDAFDVDMVNYEAGAVATSRMLTAGMVRPIDTVAYATSGNINGNDVTIAMEWTPMSSAATIGIPYLWGSYVDANNSTAILYDGTNIIFRKRIAGVNTDAIKALAITANTTYKIAATASSSAGQDVYVTGAIGTNNPNTVAMQIGASFQIGADGNSANSGEDELRNARIWQRVLTPSQIATL